MAIDPMTVDVSPNTMVQNTSADILTRECDDSCRQPDDLASRWIDYSDFFDKQDDTRKAFLRKSGRTRQRFYIIRDSIRTTQPTVNSASL